jgi:Ca2+-binding RTX toxin-like protein
LKNRPGTANISAINHPLADWVKNGISYFGGAGNDYIAGTQFADKIFGGNDNDILSGRGGNDTLEGGEGNDTYIYTSSDGFDASADRMAA